MKFNVGDHVRYHTVTEGWRFGRVIGTHRDDIGINPSGLDMATVRFSVGDEAIAQFRLEACDPPRPGGGFRRRKE